ncbi:MAG: hypothetical protein ACKVZ6_21455 [Kineosporiaceae bacterium]
MIAMRTTTATVFGWADVPARAATSPHLRGLSLAPVALLRLRGEVCPQATAGTTSSVAAVMPDTADLTGRAVDVRDVAGSDTKFRIEQYRNEQDGNTTHRTGDRAWRPPV